MSKNSVTAWRTILKSANINSLSRIKSACPPLSCQLLLYLYSFIMIERNGEFVSKYFDLFISVPVVFVVLFLALLTFGSGSSLSIRIHADPDPPHCNLAVGTLLNWLPGVSYRTGITRSWCMLPPTSWWRWPGQWGRPASGNSRSSPISTQVLAISGQPFIFSTFYSN